MSDAYNPSRNGNLSASGQGTKPLKPGEYGFAAGIGGPLTDFTILDPKKSGKK